MLLLSFARREAHISIAKTENSVRGIRESSLDGFDPEYGARPMRRTVQTYLEDTLTDDILLKRFASGDKVRNMVNGDHFSITIVL
jgi:ATP-dependent Clp protease ATP-binding subunit ClpA